jgi:4-amino-4-deoxy-L-arabinose transferase-like glycosyltransferase
VWRKAEITRATPIIILLLAIGLRAWGLQEQSLSSDELLELGIAKSQTDEIIRKGDGFPPLYHLLLHGWLQLFPDDLAARWLSLVFGCLAIWVMWKIAPWLDEAKSRLWAALLLAISPFHIWYSQEARAYPLYFLLALLALGFFARASQTDRLKDWVAYGLSCVAGIFAHYFFSILIAANAVYLLVEKRKRHKLKHALWAHSGIGLCCLPAIWLLIGDLAFQTSTILSRTPFTFAAFGYTFFSFVAGFAIGPSIRELHTISASHAIVQALPWLAAIAGSLVILIFNAWRKGRGWVWLKRVAIFVLLPVLLCGLLAELLVVNFKLQYVLWAAIPLFVGLGRMIALSLERWPTQMAVTILCFVFATSLYNRRFVSAYQNDDVKEAAAFLKTQTARETPVFVMACYMEAPLRYYLGEGWRIHPLPDVGYQAQYLSEVLHALKANCGNGAGFWLVYTRAYHGDPTGEFKETILANRWVDPRATFAGIELYQGK